MVLHLPSLTHVCCGIKAQGWALRWFTSVTLDIIMLEREMSPSALQLDSGRVHLCSAEVLSLYFHANEDYF